MEAKLKHLEFIQGVINRLADNSFRIKLWAVIQVAALLVLLAGEGRMGFAWIGIALVVFVFWWLDGYFLRKERQFRDLYDHVRTLDKLDIRFSMDVGRFNRTLPGAIFSRTLTLFYSMLAIVSVSLAVVVSATG